MTRQWIIPRPRPVERHHHHHHVHGRLQPCSLWLLETEIAAAIIRVLLLQVVVVVLPFDTLLASFNTSVLLLQIHPAYRHPHQCPLFNPVSPCQSDPPMCAPQNRLSLSLLLWISLHALYASVSHPIVLHDDDGVTYIHSYMGRKKIQSRAAIIIITFLVL